MLTVHPLGYTPELYVVLRRNMSQEDFMLGQAEQKRENEKEEKQILEKQIVFERKQEKLDSEMRK